MKRQPLAGTSLEDLDNEDRVRVLGIIDRFRELGINEDISLPQLVVVGDQSSGKSSLLEGLTGLNFPIASELCTRFATQIVLRRMVDGEGSVKVSILPGPTANNDEDQKLHLHKFARTIEGGELSSDLFAEILDEAAVHMGLPAASDHHFEELTKRFSDDVLRIELSGPEHHHLSVVDVPGLFHNPTKYQTKEDLDIIRSLLQEYMSDRRTIILAVMDARNNLANQEVFRMARAADPKGTRTVGIITKCDALQQGDENMVMEIAQNKVEHLHHGWFAVRNRSTQDIQNGITMQQRHLNEKKFFTTSPWNSLPKSRVGVPALKKFLGKLLYDHIKDEFPALVGEIRALVTQCRETLDALGPSRQTTVQQRQYLSRLAGKYQHIVADSLRGNYDEAWDADDIRKLRMHIQLKNERFTENMAKKGHTRAFRNSDDTTDDVSDPYNPEPEDEESIYDWIRQIYRESRGAELPGTVNPVVVQNLFRQQAKQWRAISQSHLGQVDQLISDFNQKVLETVFLEDDVRQQMQNRNQRPSSSARDAAKAQLEKLLADELCGILQTTNHYYADNLAAARQDRVISRLKKMGLSDDKYQNVTLSQVKKVTHLSNENQAVFDVHDILKAYYKVALKRFTDSVVLQVIERCYFGLEGPVMLITPEHIGELSDQDLDEIARETYDTASVRNDNSTRLQRLEQALAIAEAESQKDVGRR